MKYKKTVSTEGWDEISKTTIVDRDGEQEYNVKEHFKKHQWGPNLGIGISYHYSNYNIFIEGAYQYSVKRHDEPLSYQDNEALLVNYQDIPEKTRWSAVHFSMGILIQIGHKHFSK